MTNKPQLHVSMIDMMSRCGIQFQRRYGERFGCWHKQEILPPGVALAVGISVHKSVESNLKNKIKSGAMLPASHIKEITFSEFQRVWDSGMMLTEDESINIEKTRGDNVDMAIALSGLHYMELAPSINPVAVEEKFVINLDGYPFDLAGRIDCREAKALRDTKTSGKSPAAGAAKSTQMATYAIAHKVQHGEYPERLYIDFLVKTKVPIAVISESKPEDYWINPLIRRIERSTEIIELVKSGKRAFMPADPSSWICQEKWCGYAKSCAFWSGR